MANHVYERKHRNRNIWEPVITPSQYDRMLFDFQNDTSSVHDSFLIIHATHTAHCRDYSYRLHKRTPSKLQTTVKRLRKEVTPERTYISMISIWIGFTIANLIALLNKEN